MPVLLAALLLQQVPTTGRANTSLDLINAAKLAETTRVRELVKAGASVNASDWRGFTPLMWASAAGHVDLTRYLLDSGARVDHRADDGSNAMTLAAANGSVEVVRLLLTRGADVSAAKGGTTARQVAVARGHHEIAIMLENAEQLGTQLLQAATEGQGMFIRQLLARGAPSNITNEQGVSPLMLAARNGDLGTIQFLLSRGADGTARDGQGQTVFDWAEKSPATRQHVTAFLRDRGLRAEPVARVAPVAAPPIVASLRTLTSLLAKVPLNSNQLRDAHRRAASALSELRALSADWPAESPEDYRISLAATASALGATIARPDAAALATTIQAVAEDLEAKLEHCRQSGGKLGGSVLVRVRTIQGAEETKRWQVLYMPKIFELSQTATPDLFPQLSSPTEEALVPGRYVMWVRNPATSKTGERTVVKVGEGRKELVLDLPVPADGGK